MSAPDSSPAAARHEQALVSVVVAVHNGAAHVEETCSSVLAQTYSSLELIVVDDGSTDETAAIVSRLAANDSRVRLIRQQNQGVAAARNAAIAASSGVFVAPLDADDLWHPTKIEQQVRRMEMGGETTGLVYCWWAWIDNNGSVLDRSPRWRVEGDVLESLVEVNFTGSASVPMFRRSCFETLGGYDPRLRENGSGGCEDWDLALRIAERFRVAVVPAVLVGYRRRHDSMSSQCETMWRSQLAVIQELAARQPSIAPEVLRRSKGQFALHLAGVSFWSGRYVDAVRWVLRSRSFSLILAVLPYVTRLLAGRMLRVMRGRPSPSLSLAAFDDMELAEPLIPYDRIYARHWDDGRAARRE